MACCCIPLAIPVTRQFNQHLIHESRAFVGSAENPAPPPSPGTGGRFVLSAAATEQPTSAAKCCAAMTRGGPSGDYGKPLPDSEMAQMIRRKEVICGFCLLSRRCNLNRALYVPESAIPRALSS